MHRRHPRRRALGAIAVAAWMALIGLPVQAERADRFKPMVIEADQTGTLDLQKQTLVASGNVVVSKGTMVIRAARIEVRQTPAGYDIATAYGAPGKPATFRQKREGVDEFINGEADRLEYDGAKDTVRFVGNAAVRRLRGAALADEITGNLVTYDGTTEVFSVSGGATPNASSGRVRAVLTPREGSEAAAGAARTASAPQPALELSPRLGSPTPASAPPGSKP
ncbi:MAG: lipopolysaccharide transport periplasmic protein LptA [Burkholderiaceae bacterium]